ncbi:uncharacterized protein BO95DRAFT_461592 [Aspergillus brunneoviolaceus CBS 621.78]|uniref:Uncharacterized protein n=1 Tax=Aspergillus brunneoviolaceus CBS 621.78 TaxID=1450534 RepID=A0ACD1GF39_9EURO|nr:hypothetical protein BO95DRAFT_461592 [Aspergillus brunneoviolaceus CBS 621.78]RAH47840.1 hypothetical protein BO95DRAFT_461592 [Aspergillus brunneoviolaceus CBS 621.78]
MSDDEDYYDEYDEDIFWVEEPDPTIADDLAATSTNDAIFYDHPALEVEDYFSDWDDLSDDYYDEDPTAVRRARALGLLPAGDGDGGHHDKQHSHPPRAAAVTKHPRAPKSAAQRTPFFDLGAFQSVVWKSPHQEKEQQSVVALHEPGEGEKVALLKNWREVFRSANPRMTAAVGVVAGTGAGRKPAPIQQQQQQGLCLRGSSAGAEGRGDAESREVDGVVATTMEEVGDDIGKGVGKGGVVNGEGFVAAGLVIDGGEVGDGGSFEGGGPKAEAAAATNGVVVNEEAADGSSLDESVAKPTAPRSRKRKADDAVDDIPETAAKTRAKRVASSTKAGTANSSKDAPVPVPAAAPSAPVRRSARNK